ncbi:MAG: methyl-accepting chemotaxis protein [Gaiellales bacterium]|nr:methyl-accepting chemotaxis protein [Gaiellales bacterium]
MRKFNSWSLARKLGVGFGATVAIFLLALGVTLLYSASAQSRWRGTLKWETAVKGVALQIRSTQVQMTEQSLLVATWDPTHMQAWEDGVTLGDQGAKMVATVDDPIIKSISSQASTADHHHDETVHNLLFPAFQAGDHAAAKAALIKADGFVRVPYGALLKIQARIDQLRAADVRHAEDAASTARMLGIIAALIGALVAALLAVIIIRSCRRPIFALMEVSEAAAAGDLTVRSHDESDNEMGRLGAAFNQMIASLSGLVGRIGDASATVLQAADEMAGSSQEAGRAVTEITTAVGEVATSAERQAALAESARNSAEGVAGGVQQSAVSATEANTAAGHARSMADQGVESVRLASEAMSALRDSANEVTVVISQLGAKSEQIGGIVATITGIAGQTNLLALNAAIEAARAGEQGRGFAVVAEEVRKLAEESEQAASSIAELIAEIQTETARAVAVVEESAQRSESGAATVDAARDAFVNIGQGVEDVTDRVRQIVDAIEAVQSDADHMRDDLGEVAAVAEESSATAQEMSASSQQTSAAAGEIVTSAEQLRTTAEELQRLVSEFRLSV